LSIHAIAPWDSPDSVCPFVSRVEEGHERWSRGGDPRFKGRNLCRYPGCTVWIKDGSKTCKRHRHWYDQVIRFPVQRLVKLARQAQQRGDLGACPAIVLGVVRGHEVGVIAPDLEEALDD
jgi:hypothetical protein